MSNNSKFLISVRKQIQELKDGGTAQINLMYRVALDKVLEIIDKEIEKHE